MDNLELKNPKKNMTFKDLLVQLNIEKVGAKTSELIADKFVNVATLRYHVEMETLNKVLADIKGVGDSTINNIISQLENIQFIMLLEDLESEEYDMFTDTKVYELTDLVEVVETKSKRRKPSPSYTSTPDPDFDMDTSVGLRISGSHFCITGTLNKQRSWYKDFIETNGGVFQNAVNSSTNYLIMGPDQIGSTKHIKAMNLERAGYLKIIDEVDFWKLGK